jgi:hypothetical protein
MMNWWPLKNEIAKKQLQLMRWSSRQRKMIGLKEATDWLKEATDLKQLVELKEAEHRQTLARIEEEAK